MLKKIRLERLIGAELEEGMMRDNYRSTPLDKTLVQEAERKAKFYLAENKYKSRKER